VDPTEGWATGYEMTQNGNLPVVLHFDGQSWTRLAGPPGAAFCYHVAAVTRGEAWITGYDTSNLGTIYRYHAGSWTAWATPDGSDPFAVAMLNAAAGWVNTGAGTLLHWDGTQWLPTYTGRFANGLAAAGSQVWAVGAADTVLAQTDSGTWVQQRGGPTDRALYGVAVSGPDEAWAVGALGTMLHYTAGQWQAVSTPITQTLLDVQMVSPTEGYAVGDHIIAHWDGSHWNPMLTPAAILYAVAVPARGEGWAVGEQGALWHLRGGGWTPVSSPVIDRLSAIVMDSPQHGWIAGGHHSSGGAGAFPTILEYVQGQWLDRSPPIEGAIPHALALGNGNPAAWAVGEVEGGASPVLRLNAGQWSSDLAGPPDQFWSAAGEALGEVWAMGSTDAYHYTGGSWHSLTLPSNFLADTTLTHVALVPGRGGWAVGSAGKIFQYNPLSPGQRFYDVPTTDPFYSYIEYMAAHNIVSGYADNTFRPGNNISRGQLAKMVVIGLGWPLVTPTVPTFADVPPNQAFYTFIETAARHGVISGYTCGGLNEQCDAQFRPYARPANPVTRGQLAKIIVSAKGWTPLQPESATFRDVAASQVFYGFVERAVQQGLLSGYICGGGGEPCPGGYFRPGAGATRGQLSKILDLALTQP